MKTEFITVRKKETAVKVINSQIDAVRVKDIVKKGVRVIENGMIGLSGSIGNTPDEELIKNAVENLSVNIEYDFELEKEAVDHRNYNETRITPKSLVNHTEFILEFLRKEFEDYDFSEKASMEEITMTYKNDQGLDLKYEDAFLEFGFILKEKSSANLFDGFVVYAGRTFDPDQFLDFNRKFLKAHGQKAELPEGEKLPVFFWDTQHLNGILNRSFNGEKYATGSSLYAEKLGETLFNTKLNLYQNFNPLETFRSFFDHEGCKMIGDKLPLIQSGKFVNVFTDKRIARQYDLPHTSSASGDYDGMPNLTTTTLWFENDSNDLKKALNGQKAIFVLVSAGGDFTPDGSFAAPVQASYLFDGEDFIGKLPEFSVRSSLKAMLGEDYIGTFKNPFYMTENGQLQGYHLEIVK